MDKNEHRLAANRERVRQYQAKVTPPRAEPKPAPPTGAERAQRCRERKWQASNAIIHASPQQDPQPSQPKIYPSRDRTRKYRLRLEARAVLPAREIHIPFTKKELYRRYYAKKKQLRLKAFIERNSNVLESSELAEPSLVSGFLSCLNIVLIQI